MYKIRHSQNINGITRILSTSEPPIDPGAIIDAKLFGGPKSGLGAAAASGISVHVRFSRLISRAISMCQDLQKFGTNYLRIVRMRDDSKLATFLSSTDASMQALQREIKELAVKDAKIGMDSLKTQRMYLKDRLRHFLDLVGEDDHAIPEIGKDYQMIENPVPGVTNKTLPMTGEEVSWLTLKAASSATGIAIDVVNAFFATSAVFIPEITIVASFVSWLRIDTAQTNQ